MTNRITEELQEQGQDRYDPMRVIKKQLKHRQEKYDHRTVTGTVTGTVTVTGTGTGELFTGELQRHGHDK